MSRLRIGRVLLSSLMALGLLMGGSVYAQTQNEDVKVVASDRAANDAFGSVSVDGNRMLVGARGDNSRGSAYIYEYNGSSWVQQAKVQDAWNDGRNNDFFGSSVSLLGDRVLIGSPLDDPNWGNANGNWGSFHLFNKNGGSWDQVDGFFSTFPPSDPRFARDDPQMGFRPADSAFNSRVGASIAQSGNRLIVSAPNNNKPTAGVGAAWIYEYDGTTFQETAYLRASDMGYQKNFGASLAIEGDRAVVGSVPAWWHHTGAGSGTVYIFEYNGVNWVEVAKLKAPFGEEAAQDYFGMSVALSGDRLFVGAMQHVGGYVTEEGKVYVYEYDGFNWNAVSKLQASDGADNNRFGNPLSVVDDRLLVGASFDNGQTGAAYVFEHDGSNWNETTKLLASDGATGDRFGEKLDLTDTQAFVGATSDDGARGSVYVYDLGAVSNVGLPWVDVWDSSDPNNYILVGQIQTIQTAETGKQHYDWGTEPSPGSASGTPSGVNTGPRNSNIWVHENTNTEDLTFGFIFGKANNSYSNTASLNFRIVDSTTDPYVSQSDDPGEAVETPAGSNAYRGTFRYNGNNTDGIAVSGISGSEWTIIVDSVNFGNILNWFAANGSETGFGDDMPLTLGNEYRLTPAGNPPSGLPVTVPADTTPPEITLIGDSPAIVECGDTYEDAGVEVTDDTDPEPTLTTSGEVNTSELGDYTITYTATDAAGNTATATRTVQVVDTTAPTLTIPGSVLAECASPNGTAVDLGIATAEDDCDPSPAITNNAPDVFPMGETTVRWTATDASGNSVSADQIVKVQDTTAPNLEVPGDITSECESHDGNVIDLGAAIADDICDQNPAVTNDAPDVFPLGTTVVTWTATDASGNATTATQTVVIEDTTAPTLTIPGNVTAEAEGPVGTSVDIGSGSATDICDANPVVTNNAPSAYPLGVTEVEWTATDASGNSVSGTQTVTIVDTTPPEVTFALSTSTLWPPNHKMVLVASGIAASDIADTDPSVVISVTSDEAINGTGDGNTDYDWEVIGGDVYLRSERDGGGDGRVYTVTVVATDASGNSTTVSNTVDVPHSQGNSASSGGNGKGKGKGKKPVVLKQSVTPSIVVGEAQVITGQTSGAGFTQGSSVTVAGSGPESLVVYGETIVVGTPTEQAQATQVVEVADGLELAPQILDRSIQQNVFKLNQNYPNPFNPETVIGYSLAEGANVQLAIYNVLGQQVRLLVNESQGAGQYTVRWDGRDEVGYEVTSGVYIYRLVAGSQVEMRKMTLLK